MFSSISKFTLYFGCQQASSFFLRDGVWGKLGFEKIPRLADVMRDDGLLLLHVIIRVLYKSYIKNNHINDA